MSLTLHINGEDRTSSSNPMRPLIDVLREDFHLTGAKPVCREGFCGACIVLVDGLPMPSCLIPSGHVAGTAIVTIEGLAPMGELNAVQSELEACDAVQCGMCFPGMVLTLTHLLHAASVPNRDKIRASLTGNICRCTGYERIVDAALKVAAAAV